MPKPALGEESPLRCGQGLRGTSPVQLRVEPGREHRSAGIGDCPQGGDDLPGACGEERCGESGIVLTRGIVSRPSRAEPGLAAGEKDERAPDLEPEDLVHLEAAVVVGRSAPARNQLDALNSGFTRLSTPWLATWTTALERS